MKKEKPFNYRPALFVALGIIFSILSAYFFIQKEIFIGIFFALLLLLDCGVIFLPFNKEFSIKYKIVITIIILILSSISIIVFTVQVDNFTKATLSNQYLTVEGNIEEVSSIQTGNKLVLRECKVNGAIKQNLNYKIQVYVSGENNLDIGDIITFSSYITDNSSVYEGDFSTYSLLYGIKYTANVNAENISVIGNKTNIFQKGNLFIRNTLSSGLSGDEFSVAYALLTGNSENMDYEVITAYRTAGVAHIFAVSGLHIGFLSMVLTFIFNLFKAKPWVKAIFIPILLFFYVGICNFSASSIRAMIMITVSLIASIKGRRYDGLSSISIALIIILMIFPLQMFTVGFQLSFGVVFGILLLSKTIANIFKFLPEKLANSIGAVLSAQLASIPICLTAFSQFSLIAVLINLIFIPVVTVIYILLLVLTLIGGIFSIAPITLFIPKYIFMFVNMLIQAFDFGIFMVGGFSLGIFIIFYYLVMTILSGILNLKGLTKLIATILCVIITITGSIITTNVENNSQKLFVCGTPTISATIIKTEEQNTLVLSDVSHVYSTGRLMRIANRHKIKRLDSVIILNGLNENRQEFITKLRTVFEVGKIYYYGEKEQTLDVVIYKSFKINSYNVENEQPLSLNGIEVSFLLDGMALDVEIDGVNIAIFATAKESRYYGLTKEYDYMISGYDHNLIYGLYKPNKMISYRRNANFTDGESQGSAIFELN